MFKIDQFAAATQASVDASLSAAAQAIVGVEQLAALNLQVIKTSLAEFAEGTRAALSATSPAQVLELQTAALQGAPRKASAYGRQVKEIFTAATTVQRTAVDAQVADVQAKFLEAVNGALRNVPGSENTLALVQSALAAANKTYDGVQKASKQVSDAMDANVAKATETAVKTARGALATIDA